MQQRNFCFFSDLLGRYLLCLVRLCHLDECTVPLVVQDLDAEDVAVDSEQVEDGVHVGYGVRQVGDQQHDLAPTYKNPVSLYLE